MSNPSVTPVSGRVVAVDALRGFDMFWLAGGRNVFIALVGLFVSPMPTWLQTQIQHVSWEGFSAWDLIMPLFLFIVGTAMPLSFAKRIEAGQSKAALYRKIFTRTAILFVLGMVAQGHLLEADLSKLCVYCNTLQAIAGGYLIASIAMLHLRVPGQVVLATALLVGYWLLMIMVPVPGHEAAGFAKDANLAWYIDELILGHYRLTEGYTWILSNMAFGAMVLMGVFSGHLLRAGTTPWKKVGWFLTIGVVCLCIGWAWSQNWMGSLRCPIIKHLFTSSMVLWAGGWSYLLLGSFYLVIDVLGFRRWTFFFVVIGSNAILVYMAARLIDFGQIGRLFVGGVARNLIAHSGLLHNIGDALVPVAGFAIVWLILWYLYRKGTFIRI
jgi:predicted acyltransferase